MAFSTQWVAVFRLSRKTLLTASGSSSRCSRLSVGRPSCRRSSQGGEAQGGAAAPEVRRGLGDAAPDRRIGGKDGQQVVKEPRRRRPAPAPRRAGASRRQSPSARRRPPSVQPVRREGSPRHPAGRTARLSVHGRRDGGSGGGAPPRSGGHRRRSSPPAGTSATGLRRGSGSVLVCLGRQAAVRMDQLCDQILRPQKDRGGPPLGPGRCPGG